MKPLVEDVEYGQQSGRRLAGPVLYFALEPTSRPELFSSLEECQHERFFRVEMAVEGLAGHPGATNDGVDPGRLDAPAGEQLVGGLQNALTSAGI
jgi:hypothetical protein